MKILWNYTCVIYIYNTYIHIIIYIYNTCVCVSYSYHIIISSYHHIIIYHHIHQREKEDSDICLDVWFEASQLLVQSSFWSKNAEPSLDWTIRRSSLISLTVAVLEPRPFLSANCLSKLPLEGANCFYLAQLIKHDKTQSEIKEKSLGLNRTQLLRRCNINSIILLSATSEHFTAPVWSVLSICGDTCPVRVFATKSTEESLGWGQRNDILWNDVMQRIAIVAIGKSWCILVQLSLSKVIDSPWRSKSS